MGKIKPPKPKQGKRFAVHISPPRVSTDSLKPIFSLGFDRGKYCISKCDKDHKAAFADKLHELSQLSWNQIRCSPRHGMGYEIIGRDSLKVTVPPDLTDDVQIIAFRFCGKKPMLGYRRDQVFFILWLDVDFSANAH